VLPELVSWKWQKDERGGLARLDYTQNAINKTLVAPYSPVPHPAPRVRTDRLGRTRRSRTTPDGYTIRSILPRLADRGDLFTDVLRHDQVLPTLR